MELNGDWIDGVSIQRTDFKKIEKVGIWLPCGAVRPWVVGRRPQRKAVPTFSNPGRVLSFADKKKRNSMSGCQPNTSETLCYSIIL